MRNYTKWLFCCVLSIFYSVSGMLQVQDQNHLALLPKDAKTEIDLRLNSVSLSRLKRTSHDFNKTTDIPLIMSNPCYADFESVENFLYFHAPMVSPVEHIFSQKYNGEVEKLSKILLRVVNTHSKLIDARIKKNFNMIYGMDHKVPYDYDTLFEGSILELNDERRIAFYYGELPVQIKQEHDNQAAYQDAWVAILNGNNKRVRVVLNQYLQFTNYENDFLKSLCFLGNGPILLNYLSVPERGIDTKIGKKGLTALEIVRDKFENEELAKFLLEHLVEKNNQFQTKTSSIIS